MQDTEIERERERKRRSRCEKKAVHDSQYASLYLSAHGNDVAKKGPHCFPQGQHGLQILEPTSPEVGFRRFKERPLGLPLALNSRLNALPTARCSTELRQPALHVSILLQRNNCTHLPTYKNIFALFLSC